MSSAPAADEIARDATWLAHALDPAQGMVRLIAMDARSYRAASFLDDRILKAPVDAQFVAWPVIEAAMADHPRSDARWIFHIGHVGSTLVSRLLGEIDGVLALREPQLLRNLVPIPAELRGHYIAPVPALMSRTFAESEIACVKATSFVSEIADALVPRGERALFMYATPRNYIASILAGEQSLQELQARAEGRVRRTARRVSGLDRQQRSAAHLAAAAWACEMTALESAADRMAEQHVEWADFDRMLEDMALGIGGAAAHFGFAAEPSAIEAIVQGPLMGRYSKALEYEYSPSLRRELIAEAGTRHRIDIHDALAMIHAAAENSPLLARALARARER